MTTAREVDFYLEAVERSTKYREALIEILRICQSVNSQNCDIIADDIEAVVKEVLGV